MPDNRSTTDDYIWALTITKMGDDFQMFMCLNCGALLPDKARRIHTQFHERMEALKETCHV